MSRNSFGLVGSALTLFGGLVVAVVGLASAFVAMTVIPITMLLFTQAITSAALTLPIWAFWNYLAPGHLAAYLPQQYVSLELLQVFALVWLLMAVRGAIFGSRSVFRRSAKSEK